MLAACAQSCGSCVGALHGGRAAARAAAARRRRARRRRRVRGRRRARDRCAARRRVPARALARRPTSSAARPPSPPRPPRPPTTSAPRRARRGRLERYPFATGARAGAAARAHVGRALRRRRRRALFEPSFRADAGGGRDRLAGSACTATASRTRGRRRRGRRGRRGRGGGAGGHSGAGGVLGAGGARRARALSRRRDARAQLAGDPWPPVAALARALALVGDGLVDQRVRHAAVFARLTAHADSNEGFIAQPEGRKRWRASRPAALPAAAARPGGRPGDERGRRARERAALAARAAARGELAPTDARPGRRAVPPLSPPPPPRVPRIPKESVTSPLSLPPPPSRVSGTCRAVSCTRPRRPATSTAGPRST